MLNRLRRSATYRLDTFRGKRLKPPTPDEEAALRELRSSIQLAHVTAGDDADPMWVDYARRLRESVISRDARAFLRWPEIAESMAVGDHPFVSQAYDELRSSADWDRWRLLLKEDQAGTPRRYWRHSATSPTLLVHAYHLYRFESHLGKSVSEYPRIVEVGGGYGSMCRLIHRLGFKGSYTIVDLPELSALQHFFLRQVGLHDVSLTDRLPDTSGGLYIATWSVSEVPAEDRTKLLPSPDEPAAALIAYQRHFVQRELDNVDWFKGWHANAIGDWEDVPLPGWPADSRYLYGLNA